MTDRSRYDLAEFGHVGHSLQRRERQVTYLLVCGGALLGRDYYAIHHDPTAAVKAGLPNVFLNVMTTTGLLCAFVKDQAPEGFDLTEVRVQLGAPCFAGDTLSFSGSVVNSGQIAVGGCWSEIDVKATLSSGHVHASGSVRLQSA